MRRWCDRRGMPPPGSRRARDPIPSSGIRRSRPPTRIGSSPRAGSGDRAWPRPRSTARCPRCVRGLRSGDTRRPCPRAPRAARRVPIPWRNASAARRTPAPGRRCRARPRALRYTSSAPSRAARRSIQLRGVMENRFEARLNPGRECCRRLPAGDRRAAQLVRRLLARDVERRDALAFESSRALHQQGGLTDSRLPPTSTTEAGHDSPPRTKSILPIRCASDRRLPSHVG